MQAEILNILLVVTSLVCVAIAFGVYKSDLESRIYRYLAAALASGAVWGLTFYLTKLTHWSIASNLCFAAGAALAGSLVLLMIFFDESRPIEKSNKLAIYFGIPTILLVGIAMINGLIVRTYEVTPENYIKVISYGPAWPIFVFYILSYFLLIIIFTVLAFRHQKSKIRRAQMTYLLVGVTIGIVFSATFNIILPIFGIYKFNNFGPISTLFMSGAMAYAATKHYLFDRQVVFSELWTFLLILTMLVWLVINLSIVNVFLFFLILSVCFLFIRSVISEANKNLKLKQANTQLEKDKHELKQIDRLKDEFLEMATHELTTPVSLLRGKLSMIFDEDFGGFNKTQKDFLMPALIQTKRLIKLFKQIIDVSRLDANKVELVKVETTPSDLVSDAIKQAKVSAPDKDTKIFIDPAVSKTEQLLVDSGKIVETLSTLIDNAITFSPEKAEIKISTETAPGTITFIVSDDGAGIIHDDQSRIFTKFFQSQRFSPNAPQEQQGSGLSLYIAKKMIELHGGEIGFESVENKGSKFFFTLPRK